MCIRETEVEPGDTPPSEPLRHGGAQRSAYPSAPAPGVGVGGKAESGRGQPLQGHPAPTPVSPVCPPVRALLAASSPHTHTHLTPLCVPPEPNLSQPLSSLSPPSSAPPLTPSSLWGAVSAALSASPCHFSSPLSQPLLFLPLCPPPVSLSMSFPPAQSLLPHTFLSQLPAPAAPLGFTLIFSYPSLLSPGSPPSSPLLVSLPDPGKPNGNVRVRASLVAPGSPG